MEHNKFTLATVDLYEYETVPVSRLDLNTNQYYADSSSPQRKSFKIFGTNEQVENYLSKLPVDEVYRDKLENEDNGYYAGICYQYTKEHKMYNKDSTLPTRDEYNNKLKARLERIQKYYISKGSQVLIQ